MVTFRSSTPEQFHIVGQDSDGTRRVATATRSDSRHDQWNLKLTHPSGRNWNGTFNGPNVLDALGQMLNDKDQEYRQERGRGHRTKPTSLYDRNSQISENHPDYYKK